MADSGAVEVEDPGSVDRATPLTQVAASLTAVPATAGRGIRAPYVAAPTSPIGSRDELDHPQWHSVRARIQDAVRESIELEGPIAMNRLCRNVVRRFGFDKAMAKRQEAVRALIPDDLIHDDEFGTFVWPSDVDRTQWNGFRTTPSGFFRPLDEVAGEEIINALAFVARNGVCDLEQLMRETLGFSTNQAHKASCGPTRTGASRRRSEWADDKRGGASIRHLTIERERPFSRWPAVGIINGMDSCYEVRARRRQWNELVDADN